MSVPPDSTLANLEQIIADLRRELAQLTAERDELLAEQHDAQAREVATAEVLQVMAPVVRGESATGRDSRYRSDRRHCPGCRDRRLEGVWVGSQPGGVDWAGAQAAVERRQGQAWPYHQARQPIPPVAACRRRDGRHPLRTKARHAEAAMARTIDGAPADEGGGHRPGQQDCANGLGHHRPRRSIQGAEAIAGGVRVACRRPAIPIGEGMTT